MILQGTRIGLSQASRGVDDTGEDIQHRASPSLATQVAVDERRHGGRPGHFHTGAARQDDDGTRVGGHDCLNESILPFGKPHVGPVQSLRLGEFIETHVHERNVGARRERHGLGNERVTRATVTLISGSVSCQGQASGGFSPGLE